MDFDKGSELMLTAMNGFHGRFKRMYGQAALRLDSRKYIMTEGNVLLSGISADDLVVSDITAGGLGEIFSKRSDINALIFGCSQDVVAVSKNEGSVRVSLEDLAHLTGPELAVASDAAPASILSVLADSSVCLISGMGAVTVGSNMRKAVAGMQIVEKACEAEVHGDALGGTRAIEEEAAMQHRKDFVSNYIGRNEASSVAYMAFDEKEFALRLQLIEYGKELVRKDLAYGSWGNLSVRLNEEEMLITPSSMDYFDITPEDIVRMNIHTLDYGNQRVPSSISGVHAAMYIDQPDCGAVIHSHSNGLSVFAACHAGFTFPEAELHDLIGDALVIQPEDNSLESLVKSSISVMRDTHAGIMANHGAVFTGPSLEVAFAVAEAVELRARKLLGFE